LQVVNIEFGAQTVDTSRFEPISELLVFECYPLRKETVHLCLASAKQFKSALMIKACSMDKRMLQFHVRHLTSELQARDSFDLVVLCLDGRMTKFTREHSAGCTADLLKDLAASFVRRGLIDQVLDFTQPTEEDVQSLYKRWMLQTSKELRLTTHALNGSPLYSTLKAFEVLADQGVGILL
jgi:hypothetical protein